MAEERFDAAEGAGVDAGVPAARFRTSTMCRIWRALTEPSRGVVSLEQRRRARLLSSLLLGLLPFSTLGCVLVLVTGTGGVPYAWPLTASTQIVLLGAYALARTRHFLSGALLGMTATSGCAFLAQILSGDPERIARLTPFFLIAVVLASVALSARDTVLAWVGAMLLTVSGWLLIPSAIAEHLAVPLFGVVLVGGLIVTSSFLRRADLLKLEQTAGELRESQNLFQALAESTPVPLVLSRLSDGEILYANEMAAQTFGFGRKEDVVGVRAPDLYVDPVDRARMIEELKAHGVLRDREIQLQRPDGATIWLSGFFKQTT